MSSMVKDPARGLNMGPGTGTDQGLEAPVTCGSAFSEKQKNRIQQKEFVYPVHLRSESSEQLTISCLCYDVVSCHSYVRLMINRFSVDCIKSKVGTHHACLNFRHGFWLWFGVELRKGVPFLLPPIHGRVTAIKARLPWLPLVPLAKIDQNGPFLKMRSVQKTKD